MSETMGEIVRPDFKSHTFIRPGGRGGRRFWVDERTRERLEHVARDIGARWGVERVSLAQAAMVLLEGANVDLSEARPKEIRRVLAMALVLNGYAEL